jgi:hypothetical protein
MMDNHKELIARLRNDASDEPYTERHDAAQALAAADARIAELEKLVSVLEDSIQSVY